MLELGWVTIQRLNVDDLATNTVRVLCKLSRSGEKGLLIMLIRHNKKWITITSWVLATNIGTCRLQSLDPIDKFIPRWAKYFVFLESWTFCCSVLDSRHCTRAYTLTGDPARRPGIPQQRYWHGTVWQGSVRFNLIEDVSAPSLFPSSCIIFLCREVSHFMNIYHHNRGKPNYFFNVDCMTSWLCVNK